MDFGSRVSKLRKEKNITQTELAKRLFVTDKTISSWESNRTEPSLELIVELSQVLECSVNYLLFGDIQKNEREIELKFKISKEEYEYYKSYFNLKGKYINDSSHYDVYYQPKERKFINGEKISEFLRISKRGNKKLLTYKKEFNSFSFNEYDVEIDNIDNLEKIFYSLGFEKICEVNKKRKKYLYLDKYEICLDSVLEEGYFIEIEVVNFENSYEKEYKDLLIISKEFDLNLGKIQNKRYLNIILDKKK